MFWNEDPQPDLIPTPERVLDVLFAIDCRRIPVDHAQLLAGGLCSALPWLAETAGLGIHSIHGAGSQNGWERPAHGTDSWMQLSRRTRLAIRAPRPVIERLLSELPGTRLSLAGEPLTIGQGRTRALSRETTLFARYVVCDPEQDEPAFLGAAAEALGALDIRIRKALSGRATPLSTASGVLHSRSLLLADLRPEESIRLQEEGLGRERLLGCGLFIPHKGIEAVRH
ncbi:MAG: type I-MYXAN CRISPR-associated protein Cas6/Cmx6 [Chromatiaceae bacterium]|nr:type I-MYXAN CRISPR-associated protein Cas6/Cmx6 [Chromatiaceae bacterium]